MILPSFAARQRPAIHLNISAFGWCDPSGSSTILFADEFIAMDDDGLATGRTGASVQLEKAANPAGKAPPRRIVHG
jgi:hypothetical protein